MKTHGPYLIQDRVHFKFWCAPAGDQQHGTWQRDVALAKRFATKGDAESMLVGIKRGQGATDRWRNAIVPAHQTLTAGQSGSLNFNSEVHHAQR